MIALAHTPRRVAHVLIRFYQLTLSSVLGGQCRYLPTCSAYAGEAILRHGLWPGSWIGAARICRCHPWGGSGFDPPPQTIPTGASWTRPWRYGRWRSPPPLSAACLRRPCPLWTGGIPTSFRKIS